MRLPCTVILEDVSISNLKEFYSTYTPSYYGSCITKKQGPIKGNVPQLICGTTYDPRLNIQISDSLGVCLNEFATWIHCVTHQHVECAIGLRRVVHRDKQKSPVLGVHGRFPELARIHFTQTLVALQTCLLANLFHNL